MAALTMTNILIPEKSDPIWKKIVLNCDKLLFKALATKLVMMRVKMIIDIDSENEIYDKRIQLSIEVAYDFFSKNKNIVQDDIKYLFNKDEF